MRNPFISLNNVSLRLHDKILFAGLNWEILDDQHWVVVGPNGSGKSVLMRALCGAVPIIKGRLTYHLDRLQEQITYVTFETQRTVLSDEAFYQARWNNAWEQDPLSVGDYLSERGIQLINPYHIVEKHLDPEFPARRRKVVELLEIESLLERNVIQLSNGERRQVLIAHALLKNPKLLILDNPFTGLDEHFRAKLHEYLENLMHGDLRVIMTATSRDDMPSSFTHVLSVKDCHIVAQGPRETILKNDAAPTPKSIQTRPLQGKNEPSKVLVKMENVNVSYNGTKVLRHINWTIREHEQWALLGPNGAGKTTLLSLILADNPQAYANNVTLFGIRRGSGESIWEIKRHIGWVAPELHLYYPRDATCLDVVCSGWFDSVGLYRQCSAEQRQAAIAWLRRLQILECIDKGFAEISEGAQRLVLIARALVKNPALLVLDEPCQNLDADNRDRVLEAIAWSAHPFKTTMIYVTHRADELPPNITHVLELNAGQIVDRQR